MCHGMAFFLYRYQEAHVSHLKLLQTKEGEGEKRVLLVFTFGYAVYSSYILETMQK